MRRRLFVLPAARDDIAAAANWYDASRPGLGTTFLDSIDALLQRIAGSVLHGVFTFHRARKIRDAARTLELPGLARVYLKSK